MRILALPAALALAFCLYLPLPQSAQGISEALLRLYHLALRLFTRRDGRSDAAPALCAMLLLLGGAVVASREMRDNGQRLNRLAFDGTVCDAVRVTVRATHGCPEARIFEIRVY